MINTSLPLNLIENAKKHKVLEKEEEFHLISLWKENGDQEALKKILNAYLRLVISNARKFINYGIPLDDLIHEGVLGIMHALNKFDISKDFRLSTYASWWIRASIQDYILKNWSIVRTGSTASQKALFFNLKKIKKQISDASLEYMGSDEVNEVSKMLKVNPLEVQNMESRLSAGDLFLSQTIDNENENDLMSQLEDNSPNPEQITESMLDNDTKKKWLMQSLEQLNNREREIIEHRKLRDKSITLGELGEKLGISKERVRQIESKALAKLQKIILEISNENRSFFI